LKESNAIILQKILQICIFAYDAANIANIGLLAKSVAENAIGSTK